MILMVDGEIAEKGALSELRTKYRQPVLSIDVEPGSGRLLGSTVSRTVLMCKRSSSANAGPS